ncbi:MAG: hypothetical protein EBU90_09860 [Proteobacteria bacterium]|nr:hypothetical protein [Pseudomonadota bacterium]NBP14557.1 hypothetical protein [bacterium]
MKIIDSLHIPFYEFRCDEALIDSIVETLPSIKFKKDSSNSNSGNFYNKELFSWFDECLKELCKELYSDSIKLSITGCWLNRASRFEKTQSHCHINSIVSGVMYFSNENSGKTIFKIDDPWYHAQNNKVLQLTKTPIHERSVTLKSEIFPEKGKLILFPSNIYHEVNTHNGSHYRYTLAFNTFVSGLIMSNDATRQLNLNSLEVRAV